MRIVVDENIPRRTVQALRAEGHAVIDLRDTPDKGAADDRVWGIAQHDGALLITTDKGFARGRGQDHDGLLVIRLRQPNRERIHQRIMHALARFGASNWRGQTVIVRDRTLSVRRPGPQDA